jgi:prepilin-type N-terminal cleavage/methylation domain-containing protein
MHFGLGKQKTDGFTIVELLIVVVVIAILAAITIVSYNGIQARANESVVKSELSQNAKSILNASNIAGGAFATSDVTSGGSVALKFASSRYKVVTYCANGTEFVLVAETKNGKKYYSQSGSVAPVNNDTIDSFSPCPSLSIGNASTTYVNLPTQCAAENINCTFSGTATVVYGSAEKGRFIHLKNQTGPLMCYNSTFGSDPAPGSVKACYVYPD